MFLFTDDSPLQGNALHLLDSYRLLKVKGTTASFRWQPAAS
ncbi:hypothetical protein [Luteolibacter soli]|uniref:Uncharacterized protein n=1 Tax=Luteolibacter soli TaxID=3135280 RepID=A0ABU9AVG3_9BACT